jgi:phenylalanyl-tRNA synthetase alpha chain
VADPSAIEREIAALIARFQDELAKIHSEQELRRLQALYLGREGALTVGRKNWFAGASPEERRSIGEAFNRAKTTIEESVEGRLAALANEARVEDLRRTVDVTLPGRPRALGHLHPVTLARREIERIFAQLGFALATGPQVETDFNNFEALAMPPDHPARDMQDTFYLSGQKDVLLRTHTSPVQIRTMRSQPPPVRVIIPGRTYRHDSDQTHTPMFHQVEGLVIDKEANLAHLKWVLEEFCKAFFEVDHVKMRFRPSYFPFTEPSAEVDVQCSRKSGEIRFGEGTDWLEILGCGMVHPNVLRNCGLDPDEYQGFAWGMGIDRIAMLKYGMPDLRPFFEADVRWLNHYGFRPLDIPSLVGGLTS